LYLQTQYQFFSKAHNLRNKARVRLHFAVILCNQTRNTEAKSRSQKNRSQVLYRWRIITS